MGGAPLSQRRHSDVQWRCLGSRNRCLLGAGLRVLALGEGGREAPLVLVWRDLGGVSGGMREKRKDAGIGGVAGRQGRAPLVDAHGWLLGGIVGAGLVLALAPAAMAAPPPGTQLAITAALSAVAQGKTTLTFTPKISSSTGSYVAVFSQATTKGKTTTSVLVPQTRETGALKAGTQATYAGLPINAPNGTTFKSVTAYEQTAYNKAVLVAVYAQQPNGLLLPPPGPVPHGGSGTGGTVGGGKTPAQLPKTGAGPAMEVLGTLLLLGGGALAALRPKRRGV